MQLAFRDDWRVIIEIAPRSPRIPRRALGFDLGDRASTANSMARPSGSRSPRAASVTSAVA
ncbi:hypothetical protein OHB41_42890 [Streptomyces sp. NBC_01571]|uniref:hypothetical protein n=1 Tax=Streptomyces sp. NBC_01571 TaxID=2975883 RepID=UPI00225334B7|nr:hypothetical protein [Streptomyces sp. NBC_01571]MCX4579809.1 hypothetical protein [Streptomyces sp. NBC_01571]